MLSPIRTQQGWTVRHPSWALDKRSTDRLPTRPTQEAAGVEDRLPDLQEGIGLFISFWIRIFPRRLPDLNTLHIVARLPNFRGNVHLEIPTPKTRPLPSVPSQPEPTSLTAQSTQSPRGWDLP